MTPSRAVSNESARLALGTTVALIAACPFFTLKKNDVMARVKFDVQDPPKMSSAVAGQSVDELGLAAGDTLELVIKAIPVDAVEAACATRYSAQRRRRSELTN